MPAMDEDSSFCLETGRVVLVPKRRRPKGPMNDSCALVKVPAGRLYATPFYVQVAGHPGTAGLRRIEITTTKPKGKVASHVLLASAPLLVIGDHSFVYARSPGPLSEAGRALRACEGNRRSGSFRADSADVGACFRTGWKRGVIELRPIEGGFSCEFEPESEVSGPE